MSARTATPAPGEIACPDPSAHEHHQRESAAAFAAATLAAQPQRNANGRDSSGKESPLGPDGRLSSRSAATSLKHAQPQDLPSFPSRGATNNAASAAALLAKDHKMKELWHPEMSSAGSRAAVLAAKDGGKVDLWHAEPTSAGNKAASLAMKNKNLSPQIDRGYNDTQRTNSLLAATQSVRQNRQRAGSMPVSQRPPAYPDSKNSGKNALNAATVSHRTSTRNAPDGWSSEANQAARVQNIKMDREMFGEHPDVEPERQEREHQAALRASAVSMAKSMMEVQNRKIVENDSETSSLRLDSAGANTAHRRNQSSMSQPDIKEEAIKYIHLQEAAHKLAQERLAKVDKEMEQGRYREYYGYPGSQRSRFSVRGRPRKRASSEGGARSFDDSSDDEKQATRIRTQMSQLSTAQNAVDNKQKQEDRARLMAAAEKRVHARMHDMDEKVYAETGKVSQSMMDEWEAKAREKAEKDRAERASHPGKTHIGGGKYMDQAEIEAIAAARLKPTLDELNDTAEKRRARDEQIRVEADRRHTEQMEEKMRASETKAEFKRIREQDKAAARKEKEDRKNAKRAEKDAEKNRKAEEKRKSREQKRDEVAAVAGGAALGDIVDKAKEEEQEQKQDQVAAGSTLAEALDKSRDNAQQEEEEHNREKAIAGSGLAEALEKSRTEEEKERLDRVATGDALAEVAEKIKRDDEPGEEEREEAGSPRSLSGAPAAAIAVMPAVIPVEEPTQAKQDGKEEQPKQVSRKQPRQVSTEQSRDKPERRSIFGGVTNRFKRKNKEERPTEQPKMSVEEHAPAAVEEEKHDEGGEPSTISQKARAAALAAASGVQEEHATSPNEAREVDDSKVSQEAAPIQRDLEQDQDQGDNDIDKVELAGAIAGTSALGAVVAAGSMEAERRKSIGSAEVDNVDQEEHISEVSSLSTTEDELSDNDSDRELQGATTAQEHSGAYNFAGPSPSVEKRPDIMRHISTIEDSSGSEPEDSPELTDLDEEPGRLEPRPTMVEEFRGREGAPVRDDHGPLVIEHIPSRVEEEPDSPVSPLHQDELYQDEEDPEEDRKVVITNRDASQEPPRLDFVPATDVSSVPADSASVAESAAPAPVVQRGPGPEERKLQREKEPKREEEKKEGGGVRGFFRKLKNKSKADNKLQKRPQSASASQTSLPATTSKEKDTTPVVAAPTATEESSEKEDFITPVTTTQAGAAADQHIGTDGPIGDPKHISGLQGEPRPTSPSSFERGNAQSRDLDDVSSSGADEDDVSRGRTGKLAKRLGFAGHGEGKQDTGRTAKAAVDEQEESRDQFDESLAPPPAFGGQLKSGSPVRETRFQEDL